jgi:hypothetical protein
MPLPWPDASVGLAWSLGVLCTQDWQDRTAAVERELQRRFGRTPQLSAASEQSDRIGRLLSSGQLTSQLIILRGKNR